MASRARNFLPYHQGNRTGSHPYYLFGNERRYPYAWHGNAGGVQQSRRAATSSGLGIFDLLESGLDPNSIPWPAFKNTNLHNPGMGGMGDFQLVRRAGPEPLDPHEGTPFGVHTYRGLDRDLGGFLDDLSDNEKKLLLVAAAVGVGLLIWKKSKRGRGRRNPSRRRRLRYEVFAGSPSGRGMAYAMSFTSKTGADDYKRSLQRDGRKASVRRR